MITKWKSCSFAWCLGLVCLPTQPGDAAEIRLGGILPGAGVIYKNITSMRERRYVDLVPQQTDFSCGAASVATILKYAYGKDVGEQQVLLEMFEVSDRETVIRKGFSLLDIKKYVESKGMRGIGFKIAPDNLSKIKIPTIVLLDIKGYKHFVVLKKAIGDRVYVADPALGNKVMTTDDFVAAWNGVVFAVVADGYDENTILTRPPEPISAKKLLGLRAPVISARLLEFGFGNADFF